ncbi:MAG: OmpA family protein [Azospirillaceae bacterium]
MPGRTGALARRGGALATLAVAAFAIGWPGAGTPARAQVVIGGTGSEPTSSDSVIIDQGVLDALRGDGTTPRRPAMPEPAPAPRRVTPPAGTAAPSREPLAPPTTAPATTARRAPFVAPYPADRPADRPTRPEAAPTPDRDDTMTAGTVRAPETVETPPRTDGAADRTPDAEEMPELDTSAAAAPRVERPAIEPPRAPERRPVIEERPIDAPEPADVAPTPAPPDPPIVAERPPPDDSSDEAPPPGRRVEPDAPSETGSEPAPATDTGPTAGGEPTQTAALPPPGETVATLPDNQGFRILFEPETSRFTDAAGRLLTGLAERMTNQTDLRLQVRAYAAGSAESASRARRLSLDRALAVRTFLIDRGVEATRIDVRALGDTAPEPPADRVDLLVSG